jgi:Kef-type K+ transport system membrane component KefB
VDGGAGASLGSIVVIALAAALAPLLADQLRPWLRVPVIVLEILLGILVGPAVFGLARSDALVEVISQFGLALLFFLAGYEISFAQIRGSPLTRAVASWVGSLVLGLAIAVVLTALLGGGGTATLGIGLALATTALGTILPVLRDTGVLDTSLGVKIMAVGAVGEFGPIVVVAIFLSDDRPLHATLLLVVFAAIAVTAAAVAMRPTPPRIIRLLTTTLGTSAQFAVRLSVLMVLIMVWLASELRLDLVLGAFTAGVVMKLVLASISRQEAHVVESKMDGIGYGFLVPFFFVTTGVRFDLAAFFADPAALALVPLGLLAFLLVRGVPVALTFRTQLPRAELAGLSLYAATALPMVVVVTSIGVDDGWLSSGRAAGLVGAAMLSVLVLPLLAQRLHRSAAELSG